MVIDDDTEGYVAYYDVQDEDDDALPRFFAVWTTWISIFLVTLVFSLFML